MILFDFFYKKIDQLKSILFSFLILKSEFILKIESFGKSLELYNLLGLLTISTITAIYLCYLAFASLLFIYPSVYPTANFMTKSIQGWVNHTQLVNNQEDDLRSEFAFIYVYLNDSHFILSVKIFLSYLNCITEIRYLKDYIVLTISIAMLIVCQINQNFLKKTKKRLLSNFHTHYDVKVSVLIAARNEENNIEACVRSLMKQKYENYEILVMNDSSTDGTLSILKGLKEEFEKEKSTRDKFKYFTNNVLPANWYGKSYSIQSLSYYATGDILIITDADTKHHYNSIKYFVHALKQSNVDFLSGK